MTDPAEECINPQKCSPQRRIPVEDLGSCGRLERGQAIPRKFLVSQGSPCQCRSLCQCWHLAASWHTQRSAASDKQAHLRAGALCLGLPSGWRQEERQAAGHWPVQGCEAQATCCRGLTGGSCRRCGGQLAAAAAVAADAWQGGGGGHQLLTRCLALQSGAGGPEWLSDRGNASTWNTSVAAAGLTGQDT